MFFRHIVAGLAAVLLAHSAAAPAAMAQGLPAGGSVASGSVVIGSSGRVLTITQSSHSAIVNWNSFSIDQPNTVNINQPNSSSAILNRVTGATPSTIAGQLNANGVVFLINPNGIAITRTGTVNVGGGFVASTLGMSDAEFLAGRSKFTGGGTSASVSNAGLITVGRGGYAALIGGTVSNSGRIVVPLGKVGLGSGEAVTLNLSGDDFLQVAVPTKRGGNEALIEQNGTISAPGGKVIISAATARDAARNAINMSGVIEANSVGGQTGSIELRGGEGGSVNVGGEMSATGAGPNAGGRVAISGSTLFVTGKVDASGARGGQVAIAATKAATVSATVRATGSQGKGGTITATALSLALKGATLDASGATGGGTVALGGKLLAHAEVVSIDSATTLAADATQTGHGGNIVVWSGLSTDVAGLITARGGPQGGDGGKVEVSSKTAMRYTGLAVLTAASGVTGTLLLEAGDIYVAGVSSAAAPEGWSTIGAATLAAQLAQANVVLTTTPGADGHSNIVLAAGTDLAWSSTSRLTLLADNSIVLAGSVSAPNGALTLSATGSITDTAAATMSGGAIDLTAASVSLAGVWQANGRILGIAGHDAVLVSSTAQVSSDAATGGSVSIIASSGSVRISGLVGARGTVGSGGTISVTGESVVLTAAGMVDASGTTAGGTVQIGGGWQGSGALAHAATVTVEPGAQILADATLQGSGGTIAVWSDGTTIVRGTLTATGAGLGGNGGNIETSGHVLDVVGITINASAPFGDGGTWLLDPYNLTVSGVLTTATQNPAGTWTSGLLTGLVRSADINAALNAGTSVVLQTGGTLGDGLGNGDINIDSAIAKTAGAAARLTLKAGGSIIVTAAISSTAGALDVTLNANTLGGGGYVEIVGAITTLGGALVIGGGANPLTGAAVGTLFHPIGVNITGALSAGGGSITVNGTGVNSIGTGNYGINQTGALTTTGTGNITLKGTGGGTGAGEVGLNNIGAISAGTGNISLTGTASATATGSGNVGVNIVTGQATTTTGAGTITITGTATGNGIGLNTYGVVVNVGAIVSAVDGLISVTGTNSSTGIGVNNHGVYVAGITKSTGTGGVTVVGFGGGSGAGGADYGVFWDAATAIQSTGTGAITITGTGGDMGGSGTGNNGVNGTAALTGGGGAINITGTPSNSSGGGNLGISLTSVAAGAGTLTLSSTGTVTASGALTATKLNLLGAGGSHTLTNAGNLVTTLAANTGSMNYRQTGALVIGTVGGTTGVTGTGSVLVNVTGSLTLASGAGVSAAGSGDALVLVDSTSFINNAGAGALSVSGGGRWLVWSVTPASDTRGGLVYGFKQYGATYGVTTPADSTHNGLLYSTAAAPVTAGLTGTVSKVYDTTNVATPVPANYSVSGAIDGDTVNINTLTGTYDTIHVGTGKTVTVTGLTASATNGGATVYGYSLASSSATGAVGTITAATLTYTANAASRTYGAANPALSGTTTGFVGGDTLANATTGTAAFTTLAIAASNVGSYLVSGSGLTANNGNYLFVQAAANSNALAITPATLTYTANAASRTYGAANPALGGTTTGFMGSDTLANATTGSASFTTLANAASNVGSYQISGSGLTANNGNYVFVQASANASALTITPATVTYTADAVSRTYGAANPSLGGTATGFMGSDTQANATTGTLAFTTLATAASNVGFYLIGGSGLAANNGNYIFVQAAANGTALAITPATLTYAADAATRLYGAANPSLSGTATGFVGSDTVANATTGAAFFTTLATAASNVGSYLVTGSGLTANNGNYVFVQAAANAIALTITPATLTYTADAATRAYGAANPALSGTVVGFVGSDNLANSTGGTIAFTTLATTASNVGSYLISGAGLTANNGNYVFVQAAANSTALTITPATLSLVYTADGVTRTYGAANPALSGTVTGFVGSDTQANATTGTLVFTTLADAASNVGSYLITGSGLTANNGNYLFTQAASNNSALAITPATLTYTADTATRTYGAANPALSGTATGFVGSDTLTNSTTGSAAFTTLATTASNVGSYLTSGSGLTANNGNYVFVQAATNNTALTITPATLTYVADAASRIYGVANPALGGTTTGYMGADTQLFATGGTLAFTTLASAASNVGSYLVSGSGLTANNGNYVFVQAANNNTALTITPATLTYTADAATRTYGAANPALGGTTTGFVGSDTLANATTGSATFATLATAASNVGTYLISGSGLVANNGNYVFVQAAANSNALAITPATVTYTADAATRTYGAANPAFSGTTTGFLGIDTLANATTGSASFTTLATTATNVGSYLISGSGLTANNGNYVFAQAAANSTALTVAAATLTYTADAATRTYGAANPVFSGTTTGFMGSDTLANATTGSASFATLATTASNVGSYLVSGSGLVANNGNYIFVQAAANPMALTITPATLTYTADAASRSYGAANPALSGTTTGFMGSDTLATATTGSASFTTLASAASNVGSYLITGSGLVANNGNYVFVQAAANSNALTITPATLAYTADAATRTYGAANPAFSGTTTGFVGSDTLANATTGTSSFTTLATTASNIGSYLVSGSGLTANNGNYVFVQASANGAALTITPATLTYTADAATRSYGAANPALSGTVVGFVGSDNLANATGGALAFTTLATTASNVGSYLISGSGLSANNGNYVFAQAAANSTALTISPASVTLVYTADAATRTYGAANPALSGTVSGFVGADTQANATTGTLVFTTLANAASNVGSYLITGSGLTANNGNYLFTQAAANSNALVITPATLTYTADAATRTYGAANPALSGTATGFVGSDTLANATTGSATFTTLATVASNVGSHLVSGSGLTANNGNYVFVQAVANSTALSITPATLSYVADAASRTYGAANPALVGTTTGYMGADTQLTATTGSASFTTLATAASNVGSYLVSGSGLTANNGNYVFVQAAANSNALTITPATLTYLADAATRTYGAANPALGGTVTGFVNSQTLATATTGSASFTTLVTAASNVGAYLVSGSGLSANNGNYVFVQAAASSNALTITAATLTYAADAATRTYGAANAALNGTTTGFMGADTLANATTGSASFTTLATTASNVGSYLVSGSGLTANNGNYVFVQAAANNSALTITPATLTYTADAATRIYGAANPAMSGTTTGFMGGDTLANATTGSASFTTLATMASNVGSYLVTGSGLTANNGNYVFVQAAANSNALTITAATLTYTADAATRTYGAANPTVSGTTTGFMGSDTLANATTGTASFTTLATVASNVGSYLVTGSGLTANNGNYVFAQAAANSTALAITPATLTYTADAATRTYGAANPAFGGTTTGFVGGDTQLSVTTGTLAFTTLATVASNVGSYLITGSGLTANNGNYVFAQAAANSTALTITPATLTYTADAATRTYGAVNPALGGTTTGFVGSDNLANATTGAAFFTTLATVASNVGSYLVTGSGLSANSGNYVFVQAAANSTALTITAATLTYTADAASRTYGATNPVLGGTATGFVGSDTLANATTGSATFATLATAASNVGSYLITGSGLVANNGNYVFVQAAANSNALTITPATLTYTADAESRTYGAANPAFSGTTTGFVGGDSLANATLGAASFTTLATTASNVGSYLVTGSGLTANNGNYVFAQAAANSTALTITPATLTYTADAATRTYGTANPAFSGTTTGFVGWDNLANATTGSASFTSLATVASNVGSYLVSGSGLVANNGNYVFVQAAANGTALTVNPATLTVSGSKTYDTTTGFAGGQLSAVGGMNGETVSVAAGTGASASRNAGIYAGSALSGIVLSVSGGNALASNYVLPSTGTLTIEAAMLTYIAGAVSRIYGAENPVFSGTVTGFVGADSQATATTGVMTFSSLAGPASSGGSYAVTGAGLLASNGNYVFTQAAANSTALTVMQATAPTPPTPTPTPSAPPPSTSLPQTPFSPPTFANLPPSTFGSIDIVEPFLNPANALPMLLTGAEAFLARNIGSVPMEIAHDPRFDGIVACQDPDLPECRITQQ